jgi:hypothetical protein
MVFSTSKRTLRAFEVRASSRRRQARAIAVVLLVVMPAPAMAAEMNCNTADTPCSATKNTVASDDLPVHFFGDTTHLQATSDQVGLEAQTGPLPISVSGNVQSWTSGPPLSDLYTESAQALYHINQNWKILGQQLYQQQGSIALSNFVGGFNYRPNNDQGRSWFCGRHQDDSCCALAETKSKQRRHASEGVAGKLPADKQRS